MNDEVKIGDYVYLFDEWENHNIIYKVAYVYNNITQIIVEYSDGWGPSIDDIAIRNLKPNKKYWLSGKWKLSGSKVLPNE